MLYNKLKIVIVTTVGLITAIGLMLLLPYSNKPKLIDSYTHNSKYIQEYNDGSWRAYDSNNGIYVCHVNDGSEDKENSFSDMESMEIYYNNFYK